MDAKPGTVRIPIERAMELIAQRGLPTAPQVAASDDVDRGRGAGGDGSADDGFARTGFELKAMGAREEKMRYGSGEQDGE